MNGTSGICGPSAGRDLGSWESVLPTQSLVKEETRPLAPSSATPDTSMARSIEFTLILDDDRLNMLRENVIPEIVNHLRDTHAAKSLDSFRMYVMGRAWSPMTRMVLLDRYSLKLFEGTSKQGKSI